jgi:hypothetical protein
MKVRSKAMGQKVDGRKSADFYFPHRYAVGNIQATRTTRKMTTSVVNVMSPSGPAVLMPDG